MPDSPAGRSARPGHTAERIGFFTDAVFAIAMTLLVIEIPRPEEADFEAGGGVSKTQAVDRLWRFLVAQHSAFYAYILAFFILWIVWRQHHLLLDQVAEVSVWMIGLHFPLLLLTAFLPYAATVMGHYPANPLAALLFGLVVGALLVCRSAVQSQAGRDDVLLPEVDKRRYQADVTVSWIVTGYWVLTLALVWWTPWVQIPWILTPAVAYLANQVVTRRSAVRSRSGRRGGVLRFCSAALRQRRLVIMLTELAFGPVTAVVICTPGPDTAPTIRNVLLGVRLAAGQR